VDAQAFTHRETPSSTEAERKARVEGPPPGGARKQERSRWKRERSPGRNRRTETREKV